MKQTQIDAGLKQLSEAYPVNKFDTYQFKVSKYKQILN